MVRPQIPDLLKERVERVHERRRGYPANSFQEALSTVLDVAEQGTDITPGNKLPFEFEIEDATNGARVNLFPKPDSGIEITPHGELQNEKVAVAMDDIYEKLKQIDGVRNAHGTQHPLQIVLQSDPDRTHETIIDDIFEVLSEVIEREEATITTMENRAERYAFRKER